MISFLGELVIGGFWPNNGMRTLLGTPHYAKVRIIFIIRTLGVGVDLCRNGVRCMCDEW